MIDRKQRIKEKGFSMHLANDIEYTPKPFEPVDFSKIKIGLQTLQDAVLDINEIKKVNPQFGDKKYVYDAIAKSDYEKMRDISNFYYRMSGIYNRLCRYLAYMYRYDWFVTPFINNNQKGKNINKDKILEGFNKILIYMDNFGVKKYFGEVALKVMRNGSYYGYVIPSADRMIVQELHPKYCRSRFTAADGTPVVEFNMKFFDEFFKDKTQRDKMLKLFPPEFKTGYEAYEKGKLAPDYPGDGMGWYLLDTSRTIKFNLNGEDFPPLIAIIPALIELTEAQGLDRKKMEQQLLKIIIQKMPIDKNGDLVFDVDEAQALHNNAVRMISGKAVGTEILTTFADVEVANMTDNTAASAADKSMDRVKSAVNDQAGIAEALFNTDSNLALEKSILNDEASIYNLIQQFEQFLNNIVIAQFNTSPKKIYYRVQILGTTIYNYKDLAKLYKEQMQLGYSKMLSQVALGQTQSSVLATAFFENDILDLVNVFIPPLSSNTVNADILDRSKTDENGNEKAAGRPEKEDGQKSDKTMKNKESM